MSESEGREEIDGPSAEGPVPTENLAASNPRAFLTHGLGGQLAKARDLDSLVGVGRNVLYENPPPTHQRK